METHKGLPILRLPNLVLKEVLSMMSPLDLINISKTSLKFKNIAIGCSKQYPISQYLVDLDFDDLAFVIKGTQTIFFYELTSNKNQEGLLEEDDEVKYVKYSEDPITELMNYAGYVMEVFSWPVRSVFVAFEKFEERNKSITDWLKMHVKSTERCFLEGGIISDEYVSYFLSNVQITTYLQLNSKMSYNYRLNLPQYIESIDIQESDFITFDQLTSFDVKYITLYNTRITNQELNQFIKNWMTSQSNVNLRRFEIYIQNRHSWDIITDLPNKEKLEEVIIRGLLETRTIGRFNIKRNDGAMAEVYMKVTYGEKLNLVMIVN